MEANPNYDFIPHYEDKQITKVKTIKFLGITLDPNLSWKQHIEDITPRLNKACFAIRSIKPFMSVEAMKLVYFPTFTQFYLMELFSGEILYIVNIFLKLKKNH